MLGGRARRVGHFAGGVEIRYDRFLPFFVTSYGRSFQVPSWISFAFCIAAKMPMGSVEGVPSGWKCGGEASSKSGMFMGAGLLSALNAMSSGCHGPVSSRPGFRDGWTCSGMGVSSLRRQRQGVSLPWKLSARPCTIWRKVHGLPLTGSSKVASQSCQAYFSVTEAFDASSSRRAVRAVAMAGRSSRVSVVIVSSTSTCRPFTCFLPNSWGNFWRMSGRTMARSPGQAKVGDDLPLPPGQHSASDSLGWGRGAPWCGTPGGLRARPLAREARHEHVVLEVDVPEDVRLE